MEAGTEDPYHHWLLISSRLQLVDLFSTSRLLYIVYCSVVYFSPLPPMPQTLLLV